MATFTKRLTLRLSAILVVLIVISSFTYVSAQQGDRHYFPQTGHYVGGRLFSYWQEHGGLGQFGYPISEEMPEVSPQDGNTYTVQYFERAEFELHPENQYPYDVLLTLLGSNYYEQKYPAA